MKKIVILYTGHRKDKSTDQVLVPGSPFTHSRTILSVLSQVREQATYSTFTNAGRGHHDQRICDLRTRVSNNRGERAVFVCFAGQPGLSSSRNSTIWVAALARSSSHPYRDDTRRVTAYSVTPRGWMGATNRHQDRTRIPTAVRKGSRSGQRGCLMPESSRAGVIEGGFLRKQSYCVWGRGVAGAVGRGADPVVPDDGVVAVRAGGL